MRDFDKLADRFRALAGDGRVETCGQADGYPLLRLRLDGNGPLVLLTAGIHGDEPAGPETVLDFLEEDAEHWRDRFGFEAYPCLNPWGYVHDKREDAAGEDLNRGFERDDLALVNALRAALGERRFAFQHDMHEDWEAKGFYFYEGQKDRRYIAPEVIRRVEKIGSIDAQSEAEEETENAICPGAYEVSPGWGQQGLVSYVLHHHADHVFISETPTDWDMARRVKAHRAALEVALVRHADGQGRG